MRKLVLVAVLVVAGALVARRVRSRAVSSGRPLTETPLPPPSQERSRPPDEPTPPGRSADEQLSGAGATVPAPPPTTNGERVVLMSISSLQERGQDATHAAVVAHVAAGELDPDEGTVDVLLHRLAASGLLAGGQGGEPYRLTASGQAALADGSRARPSPAEDAADELSSPTSNA